MQQAANIGSVITNGLASISAIAAGNIGGAATKIERALVSSLSVALTWLTKVLGLGNLSHKIKTIIQKVKGKLDKVLDKIVAKVKTIIEKLTGKSSTGDPKAKPTAEQDKTKDHDEKVKKGLADIPRIEKSFAKNGKLENQEAAKNVARAIKGRHSIFKSVTPRFSKDKITYDWVASSGSQPSTTGLAVLKLNVEAIRKELWPDRVSMLTGKKKAGGRPNWSASTKNELAQQYPDSHTNNSTSLKDGLDRRHKYAFDQMVTSHTSELNHQTYDDAAKKLAGWGHTPAAKTEAALRAAFKNHLTKEFNKVENLFVGEKAENQQLGRDMELAEQRRNKAQAVLNDPQASPAATQKAQQDMQQELKNIAKNATDVPKGTPTGKPLGANESIIISQIRIVSVSKFSKLQGNTLHAKQGQSSADINQLWREAEATKNTLHSYISDLAKFSKSGNIDANQKIQSAIESATEKLRLLADYMK